VDGMATGAAYVGFGVSRLCEVRVLAGVTAQTAGVRVLS
jgi:hypothetical protein